MVKGNNLGFRYKSFISTTSHGTQKSEELLVFGWNVLEHTINDVFGPHKLNWPSSLARASVATMVV
jgi:hypothetical protein